MSQKPKPSRPRHKPRPRSRPRLFLPAPLPLPQGSARVQWTPQQMTLEELLHVYGSLPQVVQCRSPVLRTHNGGPLPVPLDKPMLLAEQRQARHLLARIVSFDDKTHTFSETFDSVVIPEDYDGRFLRLQCRSTKDKTQVRSLHRIAHDDTPAFLNLADIISYPAAPRHPNDNSKLIYTVGNVFLVDEPASVTSPPQGNTSHTSQSSSAGSHVSGGSVHRTEEEEKEEEKGSSDGRKANSVMRCLDERGVAVMVPTNQVGEMVVVQKNGDQQPKLSVKTSEMMGQQQFPVLARYACGRKRPRLTAFSKLLTLLDSFQETSILACTIDGPCLTLLELPLSSSLHFQVALNRDELLKVPRLRKALEVCHTRGRELARDIKYKLNFSHRVQETSRRMMQSEGEEDEDNVASATIRARLVATETYVYI